MKILIDTIHDNFGVVEIYCLTVIFVAIIMGGLSLIKSIVTSSPSYDSRQSYETALSKYQESQSPIEETSHEGHSPYGKYASNHEDRVGRALIKHPEPTPGYVVLNGVKVSLKDCKNL